MSTVLEIKEVLRISETIVDDFWSLLDQDVLTACRGKWDPLGVGSSTVFVGHWPKVPDPAFARHYGSYIQPFSNPIALDEWCTSRGLDPSAYPYGQWVYGTLGDSFLDKVLGVLRPIHGWTQYFGIFTDGQWTAKRDFLDPARAFGGAVLRQDRPRKSGVWKTRSGTKDRIIRRVSDRWKA